MAVERSKLHLVWPAALFANEARALLAGSADDDALAGLLAEAFTSPLPTTRLCCCAPASRQGGRRCTLYL